MTGVVVSLASFLLLQVRVNCLVCVGKILEHLDRWLVMDDIFPFLEQIPSRESPVIMAIVGETLPGKYPKTESAETISCRVCTKSAVAYVLMWLY